MKLNEVAKKPGTFAGMKLSKESEDKILQFCEDNEVPNPVPREELHSTLLFSRKHLPNYQPKGDLPSSYISLENGYDIWDTSSGSDTDDRKCLVLKIKCDDLSNRHKELMDEHEGTWDYPTYDPHITMSYDIGAADLSNLDTSTLGELEFVNEYGEDLNDI